MSPLVIIALGGGALYLLSRKRQAAPAVGSRVGAVAGAAPDRFAAVLGQSGATTVTPTGNPRVDGAVALMRQGLESDVLSVQLAFSPPKAQPVAAAIAAFAAPPAATVAALVAPPAVDAPKPIRTLGEVIANTNAAIVAYSATSAATLKDKATAARIAKIRADQAARRASSAAHRTQLDVEMAFRKAVADRMKRAEAAFSAEMSRTGNYRRARLATLRVYEEEIASTVSASFRAAQESGRNKLLTKLRAEESAAAAVFGR